MRTLYKVIIQILMLLSVSRKKPFFIREMAIFYSLPTTTTTTTTTNINVLATCAQHSTIMFFLGGGCIENEACIKKRGLYLLSLFTSIINLVVDCLD